MPELNKHYLHVRDSTQNREQTIKTIWEKPPKLNQAQLDEFLTAHQNYLERRPKGRRLIMRFLQLHSLSMQSRNMTEVELTGACLYACDLRAANFERANLYCADLRLADASDANFFRADLRGVTLRGAILNRTNLVGADLRSAIVAAADDETGFSVLRHRRDASTNRDLGVYGSDHQAEFAVDFTDASMARANLQDANLRRANFKGADLSGAKLKGARLERANLNGAILTGVDLSRTGLTAAQLVGCVVEPTTEAKEQAAFLAVRIEDAERWWKSEGKSGSRAVMDGEDLRVIPNIFYGRALTAMSAKGALGVGVNFAKARLQSASFNNADLRKANFEGADLRGACFDGANLTRACFDGAKIGPLVVNGRVVRTTTFEGARNADTTWATVMNDVELG